MHKKKHPNSFNTFLAFCKKKHLQTIHNKLNKNHTLPYNFYWKSGKECDLKTKFTEACVRAQKPWVLLSCLFSSVHQSYLSNIATIRTCKQRAWRKKKKKKSMPKLPWRAIMQRSIQKVNCYPAPDTLCNIFIVLKFIPGQGLCHHDHTEWSWSIGCGKYNLKLLTSVC